MNNQQINWASKHDWYIGHGVTADNEVFVRVRCDMTANQSVDFTDYQALRDWAGY